MGLEDNDVAVQYGFPKRNVNMLALLGCITIIISNILFIILMSCASRERDYEIQEAKDLSLEGRINRITYRAINKYKSAPVTRRRLKDTKPTKSFNSTPNSGN
uniref:Col_cuticle_N domain-containing protein n=1 Tax=Parastrongyloides trichosuri TaxID=131310 RepID=A0A0N5A7F0_PARTI